MKQAQFIFLMLALLLGPLDKIKAKAERNKQSGSSATEKTDHEDPEGYYTCSMHPQVHEHKPGNCPICGMPLVKKFEKKVETIQRPEIEVTQNQLNLAGISQYTVLKKDLVFTIPVSGRMISSQEVVFQIFESDLPIIKIGTPFTGILSSSPNESLKGKIRFIDTLIDPSSRTVRITGILNQKPQKFMIEGSFNGEIQSMEKDQLAIPESAVLHTGKGNLIYLFSEKGKLQSQSIVLGKKTSSEYQVLSGLKEGDIISSGPNFLIDSEAKIRGQGD